MELLRIRHGNEETTVSDHCGIPIDSHYSFPQTFSFLTCQSFLTSPHKAQNYTFSHVHCFRRVKGPCTMIPPSHTASAAQVATSRATPEIPPPLGGVGATWAVGNRVAPAGKGHRGYRSHARGATPRRAASQKLEGWGDWLRGSTDIEDSEPGKVEELEELGMRLGT